VTASQTLREAFTLFRARRNGFPAMNFGCVPDRKVGEAIQVFVPDCLAFASRLAKNRDYEL
jgi:hypothetical protein